MTEKETHKINIDGESVEERIETHISWVLIGSKYVYKIKKPIQFSFVDFSTLDKRKYFCDEELRLNKRLTRDMYLDVVGIYQSLSVFIIGKREGELVDYAVKMKKQSNAHQMHLLLEQNEVKGLDIIRIAELISTFHQCATVIPTAFNEKEFRDTFNDINTIKDIVLKNYGERYSKIIADAIQFSDSFITKHKLDFENRVVRKMIRDCHGDLHSGNIFIEQEPVIFDCLEFNPAFRQIDLLYEIAFFLMDLDAFGRKDLGKLFLSEYLRLFPVVSETEFDKQLLLYYKLLRANIRVKVLLLKSRQRVNATNLHDMDEVKRYLRLMMQYHHHLNA